MKIIVFNYNIPRFDKSSGERRFVALLELLAQDHEVDLCVTRFYGDYLKEEYQRYIPLLNSKGIQVLPVKKRIVDEALLKKKYDIGFFEFYWIAEENIHKFWKYQPWAVTIVDSVDVHFAREESQAKLGQISQKKVDQTRQRELNVYSNSDITLAVSREDVTMLADSFGIKNVLFVPNIVPSVSRVKKERDPIAIFIGSYLWPPNCDAMIWFTSEVWPKIYKCNSKARFQIVGNSPTEEIQALNNLPGTNVLGFVPDTSPYLENAAISLAPLRYGGGMKGKVNEALAHGLPVVTTSIGAQGFHPQNGIEMIVADDPDKFASAVIELFEDQEKQHQIGMAGQELNARICSPERVKSYLADMVELAVIIGKSKSRAMPTSRRLWLKVQFKIAKIRDIIKYYKSKQLK